MDQNNPFFKQVELLVAVLPLLAQHNCFALKGGTAINLFVRDLPRLSVDIDLAYLPIADRERSLADIDSALRALGLVIEQRIPATSVNYTVLSGTNYCIKLIVQQGSTAIKIEVTPVLRGCVYAPQQLSTQSKVEALFGSATVQCLSFYDLFGGKLCAALDRQHPQDLFDVMLLLQNEGLSRELIQAFMVYLIGHNRPMAELLAPHRQDITRAFEFEFNNMTSEAVSVDELSTAREAVIAAISNTLTNDDKQFLLAVKSGAVDWSTFAFPEVEHLPAIQWKLFNLKGSSVKTVGKRAAL